MDPLQRPPLSPLHATAGLQAGGQTPTELDDWFLTPTPPSDY